MELIDRYVNAVRFWLPADTRDDIAAELAEDLQSQVAEQEASLGRAMNEDELVALLRQRGEPARVASHYHRQPVLIGAELLPAYWFVLRLVVLWILVPVFALIVGPIAVSQAADKGAALLRSGWNLAMAAVFGMGVITLVFALIERYPHPRKEWDPRKLPRLAKFNLDRGQPLPRWEAIGQIAMAILTGALWLAVMWRADAFNLNAARFTLAPIWRTLEWPILLLLLSGVANGWIALVWPMRSSLHTWLRLAIHVYSLVLLGILLGFGPWVEVSIEGASAAASAKAGELTNFGIRIGLWATGLITLAEGLIQLRTMLRKPARNSVPKTA